MSRHLLEDSGLVPGLYSTKFNFSCTTEGKIGDTRYINLGLGKHLLFQNGIRMLRIV